MFFLIKIRLFFTFEFLSWVGNNRTTPLQSLLRKKCFCSVVIISFQNFDYEAQENRIRERGIMHVGEEAAYSDGRFFAPASWQAGFAGWKERQGRIYIDFLIIILVT